MSTKPFSQWIRTYQSRYQEVQRQASKTLRHPAMPLFVLIGVSLGVVIALVHVWVRMQIVFKTHAIKQEKWRYQTLLNQKKQLELEQAAYQSRVSPSAQDELDMFYPNHPIPLNVTPLKRERP